MANAVLMKKEKNKEVVALVEDLKKERQKAVDIAIQQIETRFGKGSIMKMGEQQHMNVECMPTGSISLDLALGGGLPKGRIIEIFGPESSGKTTLAMHMVSETQKSGGVAAFIDAEHAFDPLYARNIGVDIDNMLISQPDYGEQALEILETLIRSQAVDIIVVDSVAALTPKSEIDGNMGDPQMGLHARLMSQMLRKITALSSKSHTTVIFINQLRMKIGVMFGNPETTTGGNALKFYASVRLDIRRLDQIKNGEEIVGNNVRVKVVKNKCAAPFKKADFDIIYNEGISKEGDILALAVKYGVIDKSGSWFTYGEEKLGQGKDNSRVFLKENKQICKKIEKEVKEKAGI